MILAVLAVAAVVAILLSFALPQENRVVLGRVEDFPVRAEPYAFAAGDTHGFVTHAANGWAAYDSRTPHLTGCRVEWVDQNGRLEDPCSGSRFDALGRYTFGPALRRLDRYALEVTRDGRVLVDVGRELPVTRAEWIADCAAALEQSDPSDSTDARAAHGQSCTQALDAFPGSLTQY